MSILTSRKFRVDMLVIFITLFLISILGITYYFYTRSNAAVLKVANAFISRTIDSISQKMNDFLQPTPLSSIASLIMNDQTLSTADMRSLASYMHVVLQAYPQLVNAYIADTHGNMFIENRITTLPVSNQLIPFINKKKIPVHAKFVSEMLTPGLEGSVLRYIYKDDAGTILESGKVMHVPFDARQRPWFADAERAGKSMWIGIYPFYDMAAKVMTIAFPVYVKNEFKGVAAADVDITSIKAAMARFSADVQGIVFIDNHNGQVIAYQDENLYESATHGLSTIYQTSNPIIKKAFAMHVQTGLENFIFDLGGVSYIAYFKTYSISNKETWDIAAIVPMDVFVGTLHRLNNRALLFSLVTLILGLVMVVISSNKISRPIIQMAEETQDMQHFNFSKKTVINTHIYEVQVMVTALNIAKTALFSFSKYVPKMIVDQLLKMGTIAELGGEKKEITVLFSDIKNFTQITEQTDPNQLMLHLSHYLNVLTHCIHDHLGNIDKYIGDSIMAFWGAPQPDPHQVYHACLALLDCQRAVRALCRESAVLGHPVFHTRFGLSCGTAIVGNLGSSDRLNYTAIGDTVNLASRLEQANTIYGTDIIVSEDVYLASKRQFLYRPVDIIKVRGKHAPVQVYELMAETVFGAEFPATQQQVEYCRVYTEAYELYHHGQYQAALKRLLELAAQDQNDALTSLYIKRCEDKLQ